MTATAHSLRKAAVLVASLDTATADRLLEQMPAGQAARVRRTIAQLGQIDADEQNEVIDEFFRVSPLVPGDEPAGIELDGQLARHLASAPTEDHCDPSDDAVPPFRFLHEAQCEKLSPFLAGEHPQTIALVVSHLPPDRAANLLATLAAPLQTDVLRRLVDLDDADPRMLREVERGLQSRMFEQVRSDRRRAAGLAAVAGILKAAEPSLRCHIMGNLAEFDPSLACKLNTDRMDFDFAGLEGAPPAALGALIRAAQPQVAVLALAGATPELVERVTAGLPPGEARLLGEAVKNLGPTRLSDVEEAQAQLAELAQQLVLCGSIELPALRALV